MCKYSWVPYDWESSADIDIILKDVSGEYAARIKKIEGLYHVHVWPDFEDNAITAFDRGTFDALEDARQWALAKLVEHGVIDPIDVLGIDNE